MEIRRDQYLKKLIDRKGNGLIKVVTGARRSGKSYLLFKLFKNSLLEQGFPQDHILEIALDDDLYEHLLDRHELGRFIRESIHDDAPYMLLLDEIQEVTDFERTLNGLLRIPNLDIYVTGSNSKFLSTEIVTIFRDRGDEIRIHPLSFSEFFSVFDGTRDQAWDEYVLYGGLPQVLSYSDPGDKGDYLKRLFEKTYLSDIVDRNQVRKKDHLDDLVNILASSVGSLTNPSKLENTFRSEKKAAFDRETINRYIGHLKDAFLISEAQRFDVKGRKYIGSPMKYYFEDVGLRNARLNFRQTEENHLMENILYNELVRRGFSVDIGVISKYGKVDGKSVLTSYEVDFVANRGSKRYYIQSALMLSDAEIEAQEKKSLRSIDDSFKKIIVTRDDIKVRYDDDGIAKIGVMNFLLDERSLDL